MHSNTTSATGVRAEISADGDSDRRVNGVSSLAEICGPLLNTRKYDSRCFPLPFLKYPLLVTGLGGSGTHAITYHLQEAGIQVKHEELDKHGSVCWLYV